MRTAQRSHKERFGYDFPDHGRARGWVELSRLTPAEEALLVGIYLVKFGGSVGDFLRHYKAATRPAPYNTVSAHRMDRVAHDYALAILKGETYLTFNRRE